MIKPVYEGAEVLSRLDDFKDYFRPWANPFPKSRGDTKVIFAQIDNGFLEPDLKIEDFKTALVDKYLFREAKANATNLVPTFYLQAQSDADKQADSIRKMIKKVRQSVANYKHSFISSSQIDAIEQMLQAYPLSTQAKYLFTMKVDGQYFGDVQANRDLFTREAYQKYSNGSSATDKVCAVTYKISPEVWGRVDTLGFAVTDPAFARNGFNTAESYKMFPVSPDAVKLLEGAKRLILEKLSRNFYGMKYFVLPRFLQKISDESAELLWSEFITTCSTDSTVMSTQFKPLVSNENLIGAILENEALNKNSVYYDIFFFQPNNAQFMIRLHVSDVLPSRFVKIMSAKESVDRNYYNLVDQLPVFEEGKPVKGKFEPFRVTFAAIKDYFAKKVRTDWVFHPYFFRIVEAIFYNQPLDREQLLRTFMEAIKVSFKNSGEQPYQFSRDVRHTFVILQFFYQLKLLSFSNMELTDPQPVGLTLESFEQQHPDLFENPLRRAAFYLGCEVEMLMAKQRSYYGNEPFRQHLNGLNLDVEQLRKIHLKLTNKISEYANTGTKDKRNFRKRELAQIETFDQFIAPAIMMTDNTLTKIDISYAFVVGMAMQKVFSKEYWRQYKLNNPTTNQNQPE